MRKIYVVTNCTPQGNYTPTVTTDYEEAHKWMCECTAGNIRAYSGKAELKEMTDEEVILWAEKNMDCNVSEWGTELYYPDETYNIMEIFELEVSV